MDCSKVKGFTLLQMAAVMKGSGGKARKMGMASTVMELPVKLLCILGLQVTYTMGSGNRINDTDQLFILGRTEASSLRAYGLKDIAISGSP
jgi:hypothetical protein